MIGPRRSVRQQYEDRCKVPSDIVEHLPTLYDLVVREDARTVVELGVRTGNSTAALLAAIETTGGHLWSVDIRLMPFAHLDPLKRAAGDAWTFILGDDMRVAGRLPEAIDVLFIDSSHHFDHTLAELRLYGPRAKWIVLHDTELEHPDGAPPTDPPFPVKCAVEVWAAEAGRDWSNRTNCWGLGIIEPKG